MAEYFGKRCLYNFLKEQGFAVPLMKETEYTKFRGSEWLRTRGIEEKIEIYRSQKSLFVSILTYQEETDKYKEIDRYGYFLEEGTWKKIYDRRESQRRIETIVNEIKADFDEDKGKKKC